MGKEDGNENFTRETVWCIEQYLSRPSVVTRNKNYKTISVSHAFDWGRIPIKIIAPEGAWVELEQKLSENEFYIEFEAIRPYIKAPAKYIANLEKYSRELPEDFVDHFYYYYIEPSKDKNPLVSRRPRGRLPHKRTTSDMWKIKTAARHIYVFLDHWLRKPRASHPPELKNYLRVNKNIEIAWYKDVNLFSVAMATMQIIESHFNFDINKFDDPKTFYDKYIACQGLDNLKKAYQKKEHQIFREPLLSIFRTNK